jgi:hypothetical protein
MSCPDHIENPPDQQVNYINLSTAAFSPRVFDMGRLNSNLGFAVK